MFDEQATKHPAQIDSLIEALRRTIEGEGVAEALLWMLGHAPEFRLRRTPADEWEYVQDLVAIFQEDQDLAVASLIDEQYAFAVGVEIGAALAHHGRE